MFGNSQICLLHKYPAEHLHSPQSSQIWRPNTSYMYIYTHIYRQIYMFLCVYSFHTYIYIFIYTYVDTYLSMHSDPEGNRKHLLEGSSQKRRDERGQAETVRAENLAFTRRRPQDEVGRYMHLNVCVYIYTHLYIYIHIYVYVYLQTSNADKGPQPVRNRSPPRRIVSTTSTRIHRRHSCSC